MTTFLFIRHCETEMNTRPHIVGGRSNHTPPTPLGLRQAAAFGRYLAAHNVRPHAIYSSGAVRTNITAKTALQLANIKLPIHEDARLLEISQGIYEGKLKTEAYSAKNISRYNTPAITGRFPGGESIRDAQIRMREFLDEKHRQHPDELVLVFGHGLAIRSLVGDIHGHTKQQILQDYDTPNVSETKIHVVDKRPSVLHVGKKVITEYY